MHRVCGPCAACCGFTESSCLWHCYHTFYTVGIWYCSSNSLYLLQSLSQIEHLHLKMIGCKFILFLWISKLSPHFVGYLRKQQYYDSRLWEWQSRMRCRNYLHSRCRHWVCCPPAVYGECKRILGRQHIFHTCCTSMTCLPYGFPYGLPDLF